MKLRLKRPPRKAVESNNCCCNTSAPKSVGTRHPRALGLELLRQASRGLPRQAGRILKTSLQLAVPKGLNHLPDELIQQAIEELQ